MHLNALQVRGHGRHPPPPRHHFPSVLTGREGGGAESLDPFKVRRTKLSQFPGKEATLLAKAKWHPWPLCLTPSEHLTKVYYFGVPNCSSILWFLPIFWISQKRKRLGLGCSMCFFLLPTDKKEGDDSAITWHGLISHFPWLLYHWSRF